MGRERERSRPFNSTRDLSAAIALLSLLTGRAPACAAVSKTQFARGSTEAACQFNFMGPWLKSEAPALQAVLSGSVTRRTPPFHCGENEIQASLISSASVGATPTP